MIGIACCGSWISSIGWAAACSSACWNCIWGVVWFEFLIVSSDIADDLLRANFINVAGVAAAAAAAEAEAAAVLAEVVGTMMF